MTTTDMTPAQQHASEQDEQDWTPSQDDWDWFHSNNWSDPMEDDRP